MRHDLCLSFHFGIQLTIGFMSCINIEKIPVFFCCCCFGFFFGGVGFFFFFWGGGGGRRDVYLFIPAFSSLNCLIRKCLN